MAVSSSQVPSRYSQKSSKCGLTMYEVANCFSHDKGEFPKIFPEFEIINGIHLDFVFFLQNAEYVHIPEGISFR